MDGHALVGLVDETIRYNRLVQWLSNFFGSRHTMLYITSFRGTNAME